MNKSIKLNEKLECKGYWWLPSKPENKIAGILTYTPNEKIKSLIPQHYYKIFFLST